MPGQETKNWHRRQALQLAAQLPDDPEDAWAVLDCVGQLVEFFFGPRPSPPTAPSEVLPFARRVEEPESP